MELTGTLKHIAPEQQISDKFRKRDFVVTDNSSQYPQHILFEATQDRCGMLDGLTVGDEIKVFFNLRGREWTSKDGEIKYFNSLQAWKIEVVNSSTKPSSEATQTEDDKWKWKEEQKTPPQAQQSQDESDDGLPF